MMDEFPIEGLRKIAGIRFLLPTGGGPLSSVGAVLFSRFKYYLPC